MSRAAPDVLVVGGGVIGCAAAFELARRGARVALLERDGLASQASGAAAGMLAPLAESAPDAPLRRLGWQALERFPALVADLAERSGIDPEWTSSGLLRAARSDAEAERLRAQEDPAFELAWLDPAALRAAVPGLAPDVRGALFSRRESHVRSPLLARAFARAALGLGASVETGVPVSGLLAEGGRCTGVRTETGPRPAHRVVVCTGSWAPGLVPGLPVEPVRGQIVSLDAPEPGFLPILWAGSTYLVPKRDGSLVVGATEERVGFDCRVTAEGVAGLLASAGALLPSLAGATFRAAWAGLRPATPDGLPAVGPVPGCAGAFVAAGHHRNGVLLSPLTATWIADLCEGKPLPPDATPTSLTRFTRGQSPT